MRVCLEKSTGKLIEFQTGNAAHGTLIQNAVNSRYDANNIEEKIVTDQEWALIKDKWIDQPVRDEEAQKEADKLNKKNKIKQKLGLNDNDFNDLKGALGL